MGLALLIGIAFFGVLGEMRNGDASSDFHLDREGVPPALFSATILAGAGVLLVLAREAVRTSSRAVWLGVALFFALMATDEWWGIHERLESWLGIDWQLLYLPVVIGAGIAWSVVLREMWRTLPAAGLTFGCGAACWIVAQGLENIQWGGSSDTLVHPGLVPPEEVLEMSGSALFAVAALMAIRAGRRRA